MGGGRGLLTGGVLGPLAEDTFIEVVEKVLGAADGAGRGTGNESTSTCTNKCTVYMYK